VRVQLLRKVLPYTIQHTSCLSPAGYSTDFQDQCPHLTARPLTSQSAYQPSIAVLDQYTTLYPTDW